MSTQPQSQPQPQPQSSPYFRRKHPDMLARALWHDYRSRCIYMVTLSLAPEVPRLSRIEGALTPAGVRAEVVLSETGSIVDRELAGIETHYPAVWIMAKAIMPDHVHFVIFVKERMEKHLGNVVASIKANCLKRFRSEFPDSALAASGHGLFASGFNDKIVFRKRQKDNFINYVNRNPVRYYIRTHHLGFFRRCQDLEIEGIRYEAYGNYTLLRHPVMEPVVVSSRYKPEELESWYNRWDEAIRQRGVLIGAFISDSEKEVRDRAIECGAKVIQIQWYGFEDRKKPSGRFFDLCGAGRLLIIAVHPYTTRQAQIRRDQCLAMNKIAAMVCAADFRAKLLHALNC